MKRPFAVIGFSILSTFLIIAKITFNGTVAISLMATVLFFIFLLFKKFRNDKFMLTVLLSVVIFSMSFIGTQKEYVKLTDDDMHREISGVICETPNKSDYSNSYVIKVSGENYKIRYISTSDKGFKQGEKVSGSVVLQENKENLDYFESALSSKVYFNCFESSGCSLALTGEKDPIYFYAGEIKNWFTGVISSYLPGENGAIAKAMSIGDRSEISDNTTTMFNYSGISHLLVVSGLHLSLWSLGIIKILQKKEKIRKFVTPIGAICLLFYCVLTGFSVSVIRAGLMVGFVLVGKAFKRDSDSINAIGLAVTVIMLSNPFSAYSASLWLTVFSTLGILVFSAPIKKWILSFKFGEMLKENTIFDFIITSFAISFSTAVFTMPIFIMQFKMMPIATVISNLLAVDVALILMVSTVFGVFSHWLGIMWLSKIFFSIVGVLGAFLQKVAETIGNWECSTISVVSPLFKCFLIVGIISVTVAYILKKHNKNIFKSVITILSITFLLVTLYTISDDYNSISVYVDNRLDNVVMVIDYQGDTTLFGCPDKKQIRNIKNMMMTHNAKKLDNIVPLSQEKSNLMALPSNILVDEKTTLNWVSDEYKVYETEYGTSITYENVNLLLINDITCENSFEKLMKYDIIIINMPIEEQNHDLNTLLRNENSLLLCVQKGENVSIDCKREKLYATYN